MTSLEDSPIFSRLDSNSSLARYGYQIVRHGGQLDDYFSFKGTFERFLCAQLGEYCGQHIPDFDCARYHEVIRDFDIEHHAYVRSAGRCIPASMASHPYMAQLLNVASDCVGIPLRIYQDKLEYRVCRPRADDNNPWHRDHWFPYFVPLINVYLPLSGSFCDSALQVIPKSHQWKESECVPTFHYEGGKTERNGRLYSVPEIKQCDYPLQGIRLEVVPGDFALFSPHAVHGAGDNYSPDTRFSCEIRLEIDK